VAGKSHEDLYRTYLLSVDPNLALDADGAPAEPMSPAICTAIETFITFFQHAAPLDAMAAVGLGSEFFAGSVMGAIGQGLARSALNHPIPLNLTFWTVHAEHDEPRHYQLCKDVLQEFTSPADLRRMLEVGKSIAASEAATDDASSLRLFASFSSVSPPRGVRPRPKAPLVSRATSSTTFTTELPRFGLAIFLSSRSLFSARTYFIRDIQKEMGSASGILKMKKMGSGAFINVTCLSIWRVYH
jgi:hypothetical protein